MPQIQAAFHKTDITPRQSVHLGGYFNRRLSQGILDPLSARLAVCRQGERTLVFVNIDNCAILREDADDLRNRIASAVRTRLEDIMVFTTHLHTAPDIAGLFGLPRELEYLEELKARIVGDLAALEPIEPMEVAIGRASRPGLSFNRRWYLRDGRVATNPPKESPDMDRPEGITDDEVNSIAFRDATGRLRALFVNVSNHSDTIGGRLISADWPGFMERRLNARVGSAFPVLTFLAPQGNINHFEFRSTRGQTSYAEAERLGNAYADLVAERLGELRPVTVNALEGREIILSVEPLVVSEEEILSARRLLEHGNGDAAMGSSRELTSENLTNGDEDVQKLFAANLLEFVSLRQKSYELPLQVLKVGRIAFAAVPGEPFVEVGLALKRIEGYDLIVPTALANGYFGYIPLAENFGRGGYETQPGTSSRLSRHAADKILNALRGLLRD